MQLRGGQLYKIESVIIIQVLTQLSLPKVLKLESINRMEGVIKFSGPGRTINPGRIVL